MAKKDKSLFESIFKGTVDISAELLKTSYDVAEKVVKTGYEAATSETAKKIYKKTGKGVVDLLRFTPPKEKITKVKLVHYLTVEEEHIKDTFNSLLANHLKKKPNKKDYLKFRTHWRAICAQMVFGALAKTHSSASYIEMREYLKEELDKKDKEIMQLVIHLYSKAYASGGLAVSRILNSQCFNDELSDDAIDEFDRGFALMHETWIQSFK